MHHLMKYRGTSREYRQIANRLISFLACRLNAGIYEFDYAF
ncbi:hypothetical protein PNK_0636 [Candidatus Protochlamydia naegleriophila]|uniref:Uncharacterized protein n=1 Tax=Candidatus Protochlamydia naegleriophila TaxID=389348 RepID=A0A0U5JAX3_9BACT|nr:hypothetical protein PNK_0636 [Candidatus Protochlamydia naegleriophila]